MSELGDAFVMIRADDSKLSGDMGRVGSQLSGMLANMAGGLQSQLGALLGSQMGGWGAIIGGALGGPIGVAIGAAVEGALSRVFGTIGGMVSGITGPIFNALNVNLLDFGHWTDEAIGKELAFARFNAMIEASGHAAGYSAEQMKALAEQVAGGLFDDDDIIAAENALVKFRSVAGETFKETLIQAKNLTLAGSFGNVASAAQALGMAMEQPEHGFRLMRQAGILFTEAERDAIKAMMDTGRHAEAQQAILAKVAGTYGTISQAVEGTVSGKLTKMKLALVNLGEDIGAALLPLVDVVAEGVGGIVSWFSDTFGPIIKDAAALLKSIAEDVRAWFASNAETLAEWGRWFGDVVTTAWVIFKTTFTNFPLIAQLAWSQLKVMASEWLDSQINLLYGLEAAFRATWASIVEGAKEAWNQVKLGVLTMGGMGFDVAAVGQKMADAFAEGFQDSLSQRNLGDSAMTKAPKDERDALAKPLRDEIERIRNAAAAAADLTPGRGKGDEMSREMKISFSGLADLWKKTQEGIGGGSMVALQKQVVANGEKANEKLGMIDKRLEDLNKKDLGGFGD